MTIQPADQGDTETIKETLTTAAENLETVKRASEVVRELVADKGYHSNELLKDLRVLGVRTYISEPARGPRHWQDDPAREAVYANQRRIRGKRGRRLLRQRGERLERPFTHAFETGVLRRVYLRGRVNILKRVLIHFAAIESRSADARACGCGYASKSSGCALFSRLRTLWRRVTNPYLLNPCT